MTRCVTIDIQVELHNFNEGSSRQHNEIPTTMNIEKKGAQRIRKCSQMGNKTRIITRD